jgi:hypothetical protein
MAQDEGKVAAAGQGAGVVEAELNALIAIVVVRAHSGHIT